jgi:hypothetical protein
MPINMLIAEQISSGAEGTKHYKLCDTGRPKRRERRADTIGTPASSQTDPSGIEDHFGRAWHALSLSADQRFDQYGPKLLIDPGEACAACQQAPLSIVRKSTESP